MTTPTPEYITEIVGRLRRYQFGNPGQEAGWPEMGEFADLIEALAAQLAEAKVNLGGAETNCRLLLDAKNYWCDRSYAAEAEAASARETAMEAARRLEAMAVLAQGNVAGGVLPRDAVIAVVDQCLKNSASPELAAPKDR